MNTKSNREIATFQTGKNEERSLESKNKCEKAGKLFEVFVLPILLVSHAYFILTEVLFGFSFFNSSITGNSTVFSNFF